MCNVIIFIIHDNIKQKKSHQEKINIYKDI